VLCVCGAAPTASVADEKKKNLRRDNIDPMRAWAEEKTGQAVDRFIKLGIGHNGKASGESAANGATGAKIEVVRV
jgi:hypothetical protein